MVRERSDTTAVLIAGPTASGKSALALEWAERLGGVVINADSMQVYRGIPVLTAQPVAADLNRAPHRLYGHVDPNADYSVGAWMREAAEILADLRQAGRVPIVVGGTGLYFRALLGGIHAMPAVPADIRGHLRARVRDEGSVALHVELARRDPDAAVAIRPSDPQRIVRALELIETTGLPLAAVRQPGVGALIDPATAVKIVLTPDRAELRDRIRRRFDAMLREGAIEEAANFRALRLSAERTAAKAIGLAELGEHLAGGMSLERASEAAVSRTRQYAKRQETWFRRQLDESWERIRV